MASLSVALGGCDHPPSPSKATAWKPTDHGADERFAAAEAAKKAGGVAAIETPEARAANETRVLADRVWAAQCANCHGDFGKGDGPVGGVVGARDLTSEAWQAKTSDDAIASTIREGRGKMPKFELPDSTIRALVARIRAVRGL